MVNKQFGCAEGTQKIDATRIIRRSGAHCQCAAILHVDRPGIDKCPEIRRAAHNVEVAAGGIDRRAAADDRDVDGGAAAPDEELAATGNRRAGVEAMAADDLCAAA